MMILISVRQQLNIKYHGTTMAAALASAKGIAAYKENNFQEANLKSLQEYHSDITVIL